MDDSSPGIFRSSLRDSLVKAKLGLLGGNLPDSRGAEKQIFFYVNGELWRIHCAKDDDGECIFRELE